LQGIDSRRSEREHLAEPRDALAQPEQHGDADGRPEHRAGAAHKGTEQQVERERQPEVGLRLDEIQQHGVQRTPDRHQRGAQEGGNQLDAEGLHAQRFGGPLVFAHGLQPVAEWRAQQPPRPRDRQHQQGDGQGIDQGPRDVQVHQFEPLGATQHRRVDGDEAQRLRQHQGEPAEVDAPQAGAERHPVDDGRQQHGEGGPRDGAQRRRQPVGDVQPGRGIAADAEEGGMPEGNQPRERHEVPRRREESEQEDLRQQVEGVAAAPERHRGGGHGEHAEGLQSERNFHFDAPSRISPSGRTSSTAKIRA